MRTWNVLMGAAVAIFGVAALADSLGWIDVAFGRLWPVFVIAAGVAMMLNARWGCDEEEEGRGDTAKAP